MTRLLVIAGTDSSGGAGLTRDVSVAAALGVTVTPVVTAVTAQTHKGLVAAKLMPPDLVQSQITASLETAQPEAIKIGMLGSSAIAEIVAATLADRNLPIVLDPVLKSTSGGTLLEGGLPKALLSVTTLITPNLPESAALTGLHEAADLAQITLQARALQALGARAVLVKGGHASGNEATDHLFDGDTHQAMSAPRLEVQKRGTGCTLATAIACHLALGHNLQTACDLGKRHVHDWLARARQSQVVI
ncbi:hydroxymethylpyrimidine/phosphomethylpyrimidine kinase [Shimia sp. CNT1-13L.2]|uniref:bifunctional hydroxymethylpyrimidine kinase/phosphomethylpyrimidine kinase n=1 Tax=Shimia sp. CNT1-13L.2 TaxID=2959663 RepID=UPI0020CD6914|nr:hydroxymethylpyrimidine/phosphomethylpyrimidine kinase [Shimia sp. CNT1-13L.2]MCP9481253.1 hydroxymethylpyrimidine/phosphomethylpyrimidine kinase [Shimia sp. CNT1-13L.2]